MRSADLLCARILANTGDERGADSGSKEFWMSESQAWISLRNEFPNTGFLQGLTRSISSHWAMR